MGQSSRKPEKQKKQPPKSIFEALERATGFEPEEQTSLFFEPTNSPPGTFRKIQVMRERLESGDPLYHPEDRIHFDEDE